MPMAIQITAKHHGCQVVLCQLQYRAIQPVWVRPLGRRRRTFCRKSAACAVKEENKRSTGPQTPDRTRQQRIEDELKDPSNFLEYLLPRPLRLSLSLFGAISCLVATIISGTQLVSAIKYHEGTPQYSTVAINLAGCLAFGALFFVDRNAADARVSRREKVRKAQISIGDREVVLNEGGERVSRLKEVDSDWIIRRLERWGQKDRMPFVGPKKGAVLQRLVRDRAPKLAVEVGTLCGYSALLIAKAMAPGARLVTLESDWKWALVAKRFVWQATQGDKLKPPGERIASVDVRWADALKALPGSFSGAGEQQIELLFLDGLPTQYLAYLRAAEPVLAPGALVVADNAGVFALGGLKGYLEYVRGSGKYSSEFVESTLEWRDEVLDGMEASTYLGGA